jgi:GntR family transcriptional regulator, transcriptional repressor for pyruvate dehydrogenase complex
MTEPQVDLPFQELDQRRAFEKILGQIEEAIVQGRLQSGDRLPSERELAESFGASRASVREALRVLEAFGVVVARRGTGPNAGSIVADGTQTGLHSALRLSMSLLQIPPGDVVDVRAVLEARAAQHAATRASAEDIAQLRAIVAAMPAADDIAEYNRLDTEFHIELARASGSVLLPVLMEALRATVKRLMLETLASLDDWIDARDRLIIEHTEIIDAVAARQPDVAAITVRDHVLRFYARTTEAADQPAGRLSAADHALLNVAT